MQGDLCGHLDISRTFTWITSLGQPCFGWLPSFTLFSAVGFFILLWRRFYMRRAGTSDTNHLTGRWSRREPSL